MIEWINHFLGLDNLSGPYYGFWSGIGSDITEFGILGGLIMMYRKHNCEIHKCWRIGRHQWLDSSNGTTHNLCRIHHPKDHLQAEDVQ